ncbi:MAG: hypothetical protein LBP36_00150 [Oscillospiraceae bacterium]|jgi:hypothetical protein|nr:hypothetical protein [Oscillospiraceae bacterium]
MSKEKEIEVKKILKKLHCIMNIVWNDIESFKKESLKKKASKGDEVKTKAKGDSEFDSIRLQESLRKKNEEDLAPALKKFREQEQKRAKTTDDLPEIAKKLQKIDFAKLKSAEVSQHSDLIKRAFEITKSMFKTDGMMTGYVGQMLKFTSMLKNPESITKDIIIEAGKIANKIHGNVTKMKN